jgi:integrase
VPKNHFTDITIKNLPEGLYFDTRLTSFGLRVGKNRRTWLVVKGPNRTKIALGHYPSLSLQDARRRALAALAAPDEKAPSPTFPEAREAFLTKHGSALRPRSLYQLTRNLQRHFSWKTTLDKITHHEVATALEAIAAPSQRAHALKDIRTFFNWCVPRYLPSSPCVGLKKPTQQPRDRTLSDNELKRVWRKAEEIGYPYGTIVQLLILTGQRSGEIAALRWDWIEADTLTIPAAIAKNGRATTIPIGKMAQAIIADVPRFAPLLFPARGYDDKPFRGFGTRKIVLDECGVSDFTHHDLRRTFATNLAALGVRLEVTEKLLNHVSGSLGGIVSVYQRHDFKDEMRAAIAAWEKRLSFIVAQNSSDDSNASPPPP